MSLAKIYKTKLVPSKYKTDNIQLGKKGSDLFSYFLRGNIHWHNLSGGQFGSIYKSLKNSVLHFQEFIQGKSTLLPVLVFFLLSLYIRLLGHLTVLNVFCIFIIDIINIYSFGNQKFKKSPVNTKHTQASHVQNHLHSKALNVNLRQPVPFMMMIMMMKNSVYVNSFSNKLEFGNIIKKPMSTFVAIIFIE